MLVTAEVGLAAAREPCYVLKSTQRNRKGSGMGGYFPTGRVKGQTVFPKNDGLVAYRAEEGAGEQMFSIFCNIV